MSMSTTASTNTNLPDPEPRRPARSDRPEQYAPAAARLDALARAINAVAGLAGRKNPDPEEYRELREHLLWLVKRLSWVEKQSDPTWTPYAGEPRRPEGP